MGRLRDDYEAPLFQGITEEVVDLFGVDDAILYRFSAASQENLDAKDPLWDEPTSTPKFKGFKIKCIFLDRADTDSASESGDEYEVSSNIYIALNHLIKAGVPADNLSEYVSPGDTVRIHYKGEAIEYDIIEADRDGYVNNSDKFTGYTLECKKKTKYNAERKTNPGVC